MYYYCLLLGGIRLGRELGLLSHLWVVLSVFFVEIVGLIDSESELYGVGWFAKIKLGEDLS